MGRHPVMIDHGFGQSFCLREREDLFHEFIEFWFGQILRFRHVVLDHTALLYEAVRLCFSIFGVHVGQRIFRAGHLVIELLLLMLKLRDLLIIFSSSRWSSARCSAGVFVFGMVCEPPVN